MEITDFIKNFANQFDETDISEFNADTRFKELDEWSSLVSLAVINMIFKKFDVRLPADELKGVDTIQQLLELVNSKK